MRIKVLLVIGSVATAVVLAVAGVSLAGTSRSQTPKAPHSRAQGLSHPTGATMSGTTGSVTADSVPRSQPAGSGSVQRVKAQAAGGDEGSGESEGENTGEGDGNDGPGGHQDPPGQDVNHEFQGEE
jgi:hypothetical protein